MLAFTVFTVLTVWSVGAYVMYAKVDEKTSLKPRNIFFIIIRRCQALDVLESKTA